MRRVIVLLAGIGMFFLVLILPGEGAPHDVRGAAAASTITYGTGHKRPRDMIRAGFTLNVTGVVPVILWM